MRPLQARKGSCRTTHATAVRHGRWRKITSLRKRSSARFWRRSASRRELAMARLRILLSGMVAANPHQGGATWAVLQYLLGFQRLGHEVLFIEPVPKSSLRPADTLFTQSVNAAYFRQLVCEFGLEQTAALLLNGTQETVGPPYSALSE